MERIVKRTHILAVVMLVFFVFPALLFSQEKENGETAEEKTEITVSEEQETAQDENSEEPSEDEEESEERGFDFDFDLGIGSRTFNEPSGEKITYQSFALGPEFTIGKFGLGLNLVINFRFTGGPDNNQFEIRREDWVPDSFQDFLATYLPKFRYISWAEKGDPLYIHLGEVDNGSLGNGFIMSGYRNTMFLPEMPIFGLSFDFDGALVNFPYVGFETFVGNLALFDVIGSRVFVRPLSWTSSPIFQQLQIGVTVAADRHPYQYVEGAVADTPVTMLGFDFRQPILGSNAISLMTFGDIVMQGDSAGGMLGFGGRIVKIIIYRGEFRILGSNFIPNYFDITYDLYRHSKYQIYSGDEASPASVGWAATTGISILEDQLSLILTLDGPFGQPVTQTLNGITPDNNPLNYPHFSAVLQMDQDLFPIFIQATYDKKLIKSFSDLISPENATVEASLNLKIGPAVISLGYSLRNEPTVGTDLNWETTAILESFISLF